MSTEFDGLFKEIEIFLDWERDRPNVPRHKTVGESYKERVRRVRKALDIEPENEEEQKEAPENLLFEDIENKEKKDTKMTKAVAHLFNSKIWASPHGKTFHIDIANCGVVNDPLFHNEYIVIEIKEVFTRELKPCLCAMQEENKNG